MDTEGSATVSKPLEDAEKENAAGNERPSARVMVPFQSPTIDWEDPDSTAASAVLVPLAPTFFSKSSNFTRVSSQMYSMMFQPGFKMYFRCVFRIAV